MVSLVLLWGGCSRVSQAVLGSLDRNGAVHISLRAFPCAAQQDSSALRPPSTATPQLLHNWPQS